MQKRATWKRRKFRKLNTARPADPGFSVGGITVYFATIAKISSALRGDLRAFSRIQQGALCEIQASQDFLDDLIRRLADVDANRVTRFFESCELAGQQGFAGEVSLARVQTLGK